MPEELVTHEYSTQKRGMERAQESSVIPRSRSMLTGRASAPCIAGECNALTVEILTKAMKADRERSA